MTAPRSVKKARRAVRSLDQRGVRADKSPVVARKHPVRRTAVCRHCGSTYARSTWRCGPRVRDTAQMRVAATTCPACAQVRRGEAYGKVVLRGSYVRAHERVIRSRIRNAAERAVFTQPERRIVSMGWDRESFEVFTTSQKLAHRIGRELAKAFGGRASYAWSDRDGSLLVTWQRENPPSAAGTPSRRRR